MTKRKSKGADDDKMIESKSKNVEDLINESGTDSDYDGDSSRGSLNSDDFDSDIFDSEDGDGESSQDDELRDEGSELDEAVVEESDSSEDEVAPRNTVGDVPLKFCKIYDEYNDEEVEVIKDQRKLIRRVLKGVAPHAEFDQCEPYVDFFKYDDAIHPLSSAPEPKRRFIPSKCEAEKVVMYVRALQEGLIKLYKPEEERNVYLLWVASIVTWLPDELHGGIKIRHFKLSTVMASGETRGVVLHQLSKKKTQRLPYKIHGLSVCTVFHPSLSYIFVATKKEVRVYNLLKTGLAAKKLKTGLREISSMAIHPGGDNLIVGSKEGKMCWFDLDLSSKPYKTLKNHPKDITNVAVHQSYPLFASCAEDSTAYVFHGMVYNDLNQNPLIVPLEILRGHSSKGGVLDCKFHSRQPWLFTAGADSIIKLYCH
ncbi:hypothetical protein CARUB_v10027698mg [Capsella rubella]|uniref:BOP1 N-terminal domain-containing protein n=1 Tax=Capsella rubella TaxID=81985 RepID=R0GTK5_9BRAS|nr:hypothetical protein CARUB_v10027698mg [Capsella rubella]